MPLPRLGIAHAEILFGAGNVWLRAVSRSWRAAGPAPRALRPHQRPPRRLRRPQHSQSPQRRSPTGVAIGPGGMSPAGFTTTVGSPVTFGNNDIQPHDVQGGPDPSHPDCHEIDSVGFLTPGRSRQTAPLTVAQARATTTTTATSRRSSADGSSIDATPRPATSGARDFARRCPWVRSAARDWQSARSGSSRHRLFVRRRRTPTRPRKLPPRGPGTCRATRSSASTTRNGSSGPSARGSRRTGSWGASSAGPPSLQ